MGKACRKVCDIIFRNLSTMEPYAHFESGNVTGLDFTSGVTYAKKGGTNAIGFDDPIESTVKLECQVTDTKLYALISDGVIGTTVDTDNKKTVECSTAGTLTVPSGIVSGTLFVYPEGEYAGTSIAGTLAGTTFTATTTTDLAIGSKYEIGYVATESSGVNVVSFNNAKTTKDYYVTMNTSEKDENGVITAKKIILYKVKPVRAASLSYSSEGDPTNLAIECAVLESSNGKQIDMVEYTDEEE